MRRKNLFLLILPAALVLGGCSFADGIRLIKEVLKKGYKKGNEVVEKFMDKGGESETPSEVKLAYHE